MIITDDNVKDVEKVANDIDLVSTFFMSASSKIILSWAKTAIRSLAAGWKDLSRENKELRSKLVITEKFRQEMISERETEKQRVAALEALVTTLQSKLTTLGLLKDGLNQVSSLLGCRLVPFGERSEP